LEEASSGHDTHINIKNASCTCKFLPFVHRVPLNWLVTVSSQEQTSKAPWEEGIHFSGVDRQMMVQILWFEPRKYTHEKKNLGLLRRMITDVRVKMGSRARSRSRSRRVDSRARSDTRRRSRSRSRSRSSSRSFSRTRSGARSVVSPRSNSRSRTRSLTHHGGAAPASRSRSRSTHRERASSRSRSRQRWESLRRRLTSTPATCEKSAEFLALKTRGYFSHEGRIELTGSPLAQNSTPFDDELTPRQAKGLTGPALRDIDSKNAWSEEGFLVFLAGLPLKTIRRITGLTREEAVELRERAYCWASDPTCVSEEDRFDPIELETTPARQLVVMRQLIVRKGADKRLCVNRASWQRGYWASLNSPRDKVDPIKAMMWEPFEGAGHKVGDLVWRPPAEEEGGTWWRSVGTNHPLYEPGTRVPFSLQAFHALAQDLDVSDEEAMGDSLLGNVADRVNEFTKHIQKGQSADRTLPGLMEMCDAMFRFTCWFLEYYAMIHSNQSKDTRNRITGRRMARLTGSEKRMEQLRRVMREAYVAAISAHTYAKRMQAELKETIFTADGAYALRYASVVSKNTMIFIWVVQRQCKASINVPNLDWEVTSEMFVLVSKPEAVFNEVFSRDAPAMVPVVVERKVPEEKKAPEEKEHDDLPLSMRVIRPRVGAPLAEDEEDDDDLPLAMRPVRRTQVVDDDNLPLATRPVHTRSRSRSRSRARSQSRLPLAMRSSR
jgi:hypothetical protein